MIFLAVTMGFIAENLREHFAEHRNAEILAQSLFALMRGHFMALTLFSAGHCLLRYCMIFAVNRIS